MTPESSPLALPRDTVEPEDYDEQGRFLYPGDVEDAMPEGNRARRLGGYLTDTIERLVLDPARESVHGNMPIYYVKGQPLRHVSPDAFFLAGVPMDEERKSYCLWKTGVVPQVIFEVVSKGGEWKDVVRNRAIYETLGVLEYYWFEPGRRLLTALGLYPETGRYRRRRPNAAGRYPSVALGLEVGLREGELALYHEGRYVEPSLETIAEQAAALKDKDTALKDKDAALKDRDAALKDKDAVIEALQRALREQRRSAGADEPE
jgi:Uma2 family endonuclease